MELKIQEIEQSKPVLFNYEELKKWLTEKTNEYKSVVYTPETINLAREDRATLNRLSSTINDRKKQVKAELLQPYMDFENKCKELMEIVDSASKMIDGQIKTFEEKEQKEKREQIKEIFDAYIGVYADLISFEKIFNPRWLNKTYSIKKINEEIQHLIVKTSDDMGVLESQQQFKEAGILDQIKSYYFTNISAEDNLSNAIKYGNSEIERLKRIEELKRTQEVEKAKVEQPQPENKQEIIQEPATETTTQVEQLQQIDFRVWVTQEQKMKMREFFINNNIKYGRVE